MMGGGIELDSSPGQGSCFTCTITLAPGETPADGGDSTDWSRVSCLAAGQTVQALIVDDIATNRDVFSTMLTGIGIQVETAKSGDEGLERIGEKMPDILFLDIRMPVMDGPKMLELLFERYGKDATVAVAVTASVFDHQRQDYLDGGFSGFLDKPLRVEQIYQCLSEQLGVAFEYTEARDAAVEADVDWRGVVLPAEVHGDLTSAIRDHSVTRLRRHVKALEQLGVEGQALAAHLGDLMRRYDMDGVKTVLETIEHK